MRESALPWNIRTGGKLEERRDRTSHTGDADDIKLLAANTPDKWWREWLAGGGVEVVRQREIRGNSSFFFSDVTQG
jgi:hypothetical protein